MARSVSVKSSAIMPARNSTISDRMAWRYEFVRGGDHPEENRTNPGRASLGDLVDAEKGRFPPRGNHLREQRPRQRLRSSQHRRDHRAQHPRLRRRLQPAVRVDDRRRPDDQREQNRRFVPMNAAMRSKR